MWINLPRDLFNLREREREGGISDCRLHYKPNIFNPHKCICSAINS